MFLDLKLHDIPNTVAKAVEALAPLRPALLTVHAAGGRRCWPPQRPRAGPGTKVVAVTVLTSLDESDLAATGVQSSPAEQVERLARLAREVRSRRDRLFRSGGRRRPRRLVRRTSSSSRECGPLAARSATRSASSLRARRWTAGASILVIGRPITGAADPARAIADIMDELSPSLPEPMRI